MWLIEKILLRAMVTALRLVAPANRAKALESAVIEIDWSDAIMGVAWELVSLLAESELPLVRVGQLAESLRGAIEENHPDKVLLARTQGQDARYVFATKGEVVLIKNVEDLGRMLLSYAEGL